MSVRDVVTAASGVLLAAGLAAHLAGGAGVRDALLAAAALVAVGPIARRAIRALRVRAFTIDLLVTVAILGALAIGEVVEAGVVGFLFLVGAWLEARTLERTRASLRALISLAPTRATVLRDGVRVEVDAGEVLVGESVAVASGERIAVDGVITRGEAHVDEASITGEPIPVRRGVGDRVRAASILTTGYLELTAEQVGPDTTFGRIVDLVQDAQESRTPRQRFLERFARFYTPGVLVLSVLVFALTRDLEFALVFLVIACPGALVISVPVAAVAGLGTIARHGVLIKSGEALEALAAADTLVLDKTGTLTLGRPVVTAVVPAPGIPEEELLRLAAAVESGSEHHLARAVLAEAEQRGLTIPDADAFDVTPGAGISALVAGRKVTVGTADLVTADATGPGARLLARADAEESAGATVVFVAEDGRPVGLIAIADAPRPEAAEAVAALRRGGIGRIVVLSGDADGPTGRLAAAVGIDEARARLLPADKERAVADLQRGGARVAMIGDGVNDAPGLARAEVGVAMGMAGTDVSMETADVVLLTDRLDQFAHALRVARATVRVMRQNTAIALLTVGVLMLGVLLRSVGLAGGMLVHELSVLLVIVNALRLLRLRGPGHRSPAEVRREEALL